jgi:thiol-disulfide isomerase/thioredoxin
VERRSVLLLAAVGLLIVAVLLLKQGGILQGASEANPDLAARATEVVLIESAIESEGGQSDDEVAGAASPARVEDQAPPSFPVELLGAALKDKRPVMILFHSTNCQPCKVMEAVTARVRPDFEQDIAFVDVIVSDSANQSLIQEYQIRAIPTTVLIDVKGEKRVGLGVIAEDQLRDALDEMRQDL